MPFSFLLVLAFLLCAVISPLVGAGIIWALCLKQWRDTGKRAGQMGGISAVTFIAIYFALNFLPGEDIPIQPMAVVVAGGAGFTVGALSACVWIWIRVGRGFARLP